MWGCIMNATLTAVGEIPKADPDDFRPDPHAGFSKHRPRHPLIDLGMHTVVATRHADGMMLMTDPRTRQMETEALELGGITSGALHAFYSNALLLSNPPKHAQRRAPAARSFAPKLLDAWRPRIREVVSGLIEPTVDAKKTAFLASIASPLPAKIIAEILGAPDEDAPRFAAMVHTMTRGLGGFRHSDFPAIEAAATELQTYVRRLLDDRRRSPRDDFLTDYLARVDEAGELDPVETLMQIVAIIIGGSDTTRFGLTAMLSLLLSDRAQWEAVCTDPALVPGAVLEALRYEPPVGSIGRVLVEPMEVGGQELPPGSILNVSLLSAQRDEDVYERPQEFDIGRSDHQKWNITFGHGAHKCLGPGSSSPAAA
jgi:cytochrome P450